MSGMKDSSDVDNNTCVHIHSCQLLCSAELTGAVFME